VKDLDEMRSAASKYQPGFLQHAEGYTKLERYSNISEFISLANSRLARAGIDEATNRKLRCIINLASYPSQNLPTDSADKGIT